MVCAVLAILSARIGHSALAHTMALEQRDLRINIRAAVQGAPRSGTGIPRSWHLPSRRQYVSYLGSPGLSWNIFWAPRTGQIDVWLELQFKAEAHCLQART